MIKEIEIVESEVGKIVILFDVRYHNYFAYLQSYPKINVSTKFKFSIVKSIEDKVLSETVLS